MAQPKQDPLPSAGGTYIRDKKTRKPVLQVPAETPPATPGNTAEPPKGDA